MNQPPLYYDKSRDLLRLLIIIDEDIKVESSTHVLVLDMATYFSSALILRDLYMAKGIYPETAIRLYAAYHQYKMLTDWRFRCSSFPIANETLVDMKNSIDPRHIIALKSFKSTLDIFASEMLHDGEIYNLSIRSISFAIERCIDGTIESGMYGISNWDHVAKFIRANQLAHNISNELISVKHPNHSIVGGFAFQDGWYSMVTNDSPIEMRALKNWIMNKSAIGGIEFRNYLMTEMNIVLEYDDLTETCVEIEPTSGDDIDRAFKILPDYHYGIMFVPIPNRKYLSEFIVNPPIQPLSDWHSYKKPPKWICSKHIRKTPITNVGPYNYYGKI